LEIFLTCVDIASSFNQLSDQSWIANAYILTNTAFLPAYGQFADIFGRHIVMQSAIFIFLVGSALCTGAQTWNMIMAGRAIAGIGGNYFSKLF
jgi:MFS family permease